ncbi:hypothetical protein HS125_17570 [bacterium]|nr:hypothetical protein [bacterium]
MKINLRVDYHGLGRFINDVENGERFMRVDGLVINNGEISILLLLLLLILILLVFPIQAGSNAGETSPHVRRRYRC